MDNCVPFGTAEWHKHVSMLNKSSVSLFVVLIHPATVFQP